MWFNEETQRWEKFETTPVFNACFNILSKKEDDVALRDMIVSSSCEFPEEVPFEELEAIAVDMSGHEPIYSKGWKKFFEWEI